MSTQITSDPCVFCGEPTVFGAGRFVNRIPADTTDVLTGEYRSGYACAPCMACEECGGLDECESGCTEAAA